MEQKNINVFHKSTYIKKLKKLTRMIIVIKGANLFL